MLSLNLLVRAKGIVNGKVEFDARSESRLLGREWMLVLRTRMVCSSLVLSMETLMSSILYFERA
jgi:hypothetical protein